jgi:hypothetical protein
MGADAAATVAAALEVSVPALLVTACIGCALPPPLARAYGAVSVAQHPSQGMDGQGGGRMALGVVGNAAGARAARGADNPVGAGGPGRRSDRPLCAVAARRRCRCNGLGGGRQPGRVQHPWAAPVRHGVTLAPMVMHTYRNDTNGEQSRPPAPCPHSNTLRTPHAPSSPQVQPPPLISLHQRPKDALQREKGQSGARRRDARTGQTPRSLGLDVLVEPRQPCHPRVPQFSHAAAQPAHACAYGPSWRPSPAVAHEGCTKNRRGSLSLFSCSFSVTSVLLMAVNGTLPIPHRPR